MAGSEDGFDRSVVGFAVVVFESAAVGGLCSNFSTDGAGFGAAEGIAFVGVTAGWDSDVWPAVAPGVCVPAEAVGGFVATPVPSCGFEVLTLTAADLAVAFAALGFTVAVVASGFVPSEAGVAPVALGFVARTAESAGFGGTEGRRSARTSMARIGPA